MGEVFGGVPPTYDFSDEVTPAEPGKIIYCYLCGPRKNPQAILRPLANKLGRATRVHLVACEICWYKWLRPNRRRPNAEPMRAYPKGAR